MSKVRFVVTNVKTLKSVRFDNAASVASWLLGRQLSFHVIIKVVDDTAIPFTPDTGDVLLIAKQLNAL